MNGMVGHPSQYGYNYMVSNKLLPNQPINIEDITNKIYIFEPY